jgi:hypothetical protein
VRVTPPFPRNRPASFRATVHGTVFGDRAEVVDGLEEGEDLLLLPGPPMDDDPGVWVHRCGGDLVGHLPPEIGFWLAPWLLRGGLARARAVRVRNRDTPSWRRLVIEVNCVCPRAGGGVAPS